MAMIDEGKGLPIGALEMAREKAQYVIVQVIEQIEKAGTVTGVKTEGLPDTFKVEQKVDKVMGKLIGIDLKKGRANRDTY